jgi:hypothetical protein
MCTISLGRNHQALIQFFSLISYCFIVFASQRKTAATQEFIYADVSHHAVRVDFPRAKNRSVLLLHNDARPDCEFSTMYSAHLAARLERANGEFWSALAYYVIIWTQRRSALLLFLRPAQLPLT